MKILKVKKSSTIGIDMAGTQAVKGFKIVLFTGEVPEKAIVLAEEGVKINQSKLLPFFLPVAAVLKSGKTGKDIPVTDLTDKLQCLAGKAWTF